MPKVTLRDIAREAGVHPSTVSRALDPAKASLVNDETRAQVQAAAQALGYQPDVVARSLRRGRTMTLGVVVADLGNPYIAPVLRGIENNLESRGLMAMIAETQDDRSRFNRVLDHLVSRRVDAIITTAARTGDEHTLRKVARSVPVVLAVRNLPGTRLPSVTHDDDRGGRLAAEHLAELGHRRVGQLEGPRDISSFVERAAGFAAAAERLGVEIVESPEWAAHPTRPEGRRLMEALLASGAVLPPALFAHNDLMAMGALQALGEAGLRCPDHVLIIGYNDTPATEFVDPPLSTIRLPGYELGRLAADMAVMLIEEPTREPAQLTLPPTLVARESTLGRRGPAALSVHRGAEIPTEVSAGR
jgi:LacI family transcriptional regulator